MCKEGIGSSHRRKTCFLQPFFQVVLRCGSWRQFRVWNSEFWFSALTEQADPGCLPPVSLVVRAVLVFGGSEGTLHCLGWGATYMRQGEGLHVNPSFCCVAFQHAFSQYSQDPCVKSLGSLANAISRYYLLFILIKDTCVLKEARLGIVSVTSHLGHAVLLWTRMTSVLFVTLFIQAHLFKMMPSQEESRKSFLVLFQMGNLLCNYGFSTGGL